jgi:hypothetical protein
MKTITLSAVYDGERIRLEEAYPLKPNTRLLVTVLDGREIADSDWWNRFAAAGLARAYGPDEPEYTPSMIKESNPDYAGG